MTEKLNRSVSGYIVPERCQILTIAGMMDEDITRDSSDGQHH